MTIGNKYLVNLTDETGFKGILLSKEGDMLVFEIEEKNSVVNTGGSPYVYVPAYCQVNPLQIVSAKEVYEPEECEEFWVNSYNDYNCQEEPTKILLNSWQKEKIKKELYETKEECLKNQEEK